MCPQASAGYVAQVKYAWQHQPDAVLNQAAPVQNTWYTVLAANDDVCIYTISYQVTVTGETLEIEVVVDGITRTLSKAVAAATPEMCYTDGWLLSADNIYSIGAMILFINEQSPIKGQNISVRMRKTTNAGNGNLQSKVMWARLLPT